jgi:hypothetical protein
LKEATLEGDKYGILAISAGYMFILSYEMEGRVACERKQEGAGVNL